MDIVSLTRSQFLYEKKTISCVLKFTELKDIWLINCPEGSQHYLMQKKLKISQISTIIITDLNIHNISGLLGLFSSLSLINRKRSLHIYGPENLDKYLDLGKRYSQTNFRYDIYCHILQTGSIIYNDNYEIYFLRKSMKFDIIIVMSEIYGKFKLYKAKEFNIEVGPIYGQLKQSGNFMLPDGLILNGSNFASLNSYGKKISYIWTKYYCRQASEIISESQSILYEI